MSIMYLVWPHEANEENDGESDSKDVDAPEPGTLEGGQNEGINDTRLECTYTDAVCESLNSITTYNDA